MDSFFPVFDMNNLSHISVVWKRACHKYRRAFPYCKVPSFKKRTKLQNDKVNFTMLCANTILLFLELGRASWPKKGKGTVTQEGAALGWGRGQELFKLGLPIKQNKQKKQTRKQVNYQIFIHSQKKASLTWETDLIFPWNCGITATRQHWFSMRAVLTAAFQFRK